MQLWAFNFHIPTGCLFWICSALAGKGKQRATLSEGHIQIKTWWKDSEISTCTEKWDTHISLIRRCKATSAVSKILHSAQADFRESIRVQRATINVNKRYNGSYFSFCLWSSIIYIEMNFTELKAWLKKPKTKYYLSLYFCNHFWKRNIKELSENSMLTSNVRFFFWLI